MAPSLLNGERAVVLVFIVRMLCSAPFSLLLRESVALSLLAVSALFVEVCVDESSVVLTKLNSRIGTSSGILLGGVTLPAVMFSKLIQLSRTLSSKEIELEEFEYQKVLYWVTSTSCFSVLVFLSLVIQRSSSQRYASTNSTWKLQFGFIGIMLCAVLYFLGSSAESYYGFKWLSIIGHGVATVLLIQRILRTFPSCASIGEALLVTAGLAAYSGDMLRSTLAKILKYLLPNALNVQHGVRRSEISTVIQAYLLGLLLFPRVFKFADRILDRFTSSSFYNSSRCNHFRTSVLFFGFLAVNIIVIIPLWMQFVQDFQVHPLMWVLMFIFSEPVKRLSLCIYWVIVICVSVCRFYFISKSSKIERILLRKYYHLMAVSMFVPALILQPKFLNLAFGVALAVFLILEIIRVWRIWPCGEIIHQFMNAFTDHRDSDLLIVSHFSLLLGCALPIWMSSGFNDRPLAPFAGILSLGIGDTMASMVGHKYGVLRWSKTGKKTIEGTAAGITSVLAACFVLLPLLALTGYIPKQNLSSLLFAVTLSGLLEAYTAQLDNAFIPLVFYSLLCL